MMKKTSNSYCRKCKYGCEIGTSHVGCNYYLMTNKHRNCEIGECDKFEPGRKTRKWKETWT